VAPKADLPVVPLREVIVDQLKVEPQVVLNQVAIADQPVDRKAVPSLVIADQLAVLNLAVIVVLPLQEAIAELLVVPLRVAIVNQMRASALVNVIAPTIVV
jgi:hypothetical protein